MNISILITYLQRLQAEHGDIDVVVDGDFEIEQPAPQLVKLVQGTLYSPEDYREITARATLTDEQLAAEWATNSVAHDTWVNAAAYVADMRSTRDTMQQYAAEWEGAPWTVAL